MERTAHQLMAARLPEGYSSVGVVVNIRHLAPTPVGSQVRVPRRGAVRHRQPGDLHSSGMG